MVIRKRPGKLKRNSSMPNTEEYKIEFNNLEQL